MYEDTYIPHTSPTQVANTIAAFEDKTLVRYNGDYKFYMDQNARLAAKV